LIADATKRLVRGIKDSAFENSENGFRRYCASDIPYVKFFACAQPSIVTWKDFSPEFFSPSFLEISGGFQDE
jgi:hypothetical protein